MRDHFLFDFRQPLRDCSHLQLIVFGYLAQTGGFVDESAHFLTQFFGMEFVCFHTGGSTGDRDSDVSPAGKSVPEGSFRGT